MTSDTATLSVDTPINDIELSVGTDSRILTVSVYSRRAEVTRVCKFKVASGQNLVHLSGLPRVLDPQSLRVEGRGKATIHDVTLSFIPPPGAPQTSPELETLEEERVLTEKALERCQKTLKAMEVFIDTMTFASLEASSLTDVTENYDVAAAQLDKKVIDLEKKLKSNLDALAAEKARSTESAGSAYNSIMNRRVSVGVIAEEVSEVQLTFIYAVSTAYWVASYDIRVSLQDKKTPVTLIYKAIIKQSTGEDWKNVPITLETVTPTYGVGVPTLRPWKLAVVQHRSTAYATIPQIDMHQPPVIVRQRSYSRSSRSRSPSSMRLGHISTPEPMGFSGTQITSQGNISATYRIPGLVTIPADYVEKAFTIVELSLDASLSWISVPKVDPKAHLNAKIKNNSDYTLLPGSASIYVDGSFISRTEMSVVSPQETFDCALGLDPSVRIMYHPKSKHITRTAGFGFYNKSSVHVYAQRITVHNSKPGFAVENLKIVEQVPVSEDAQVGVKLVKPALTLPGTGGTVPTKGKDSVPHVNVEDGVVAQWGGSDGTDVDVGSLGRDGMINFLCTVPAQAKINLLLQWEVSIPGKAKVAGL